MAPHTTHSFGFLLITGKSGMQYISCRSPPVPNYFCNKSEHTLHSIRYCTLHSSIDHRNYFQTSNCHVTWIIKKVNSIPMHCGVAYESVHSLARGHVIRVCGYYDSDKLIWINPPKPGPQSRSLCGAVCALSIAMVLY